MKTKVQKIFRLTVLGFALVSQSLPVSAGLVHLPEVFVGTSGASGSTVGARYSTDNIQHIGCSIENTNGSFVVCSATDRTGKTLACTSTEASYLTTAKAITDFSSINFSVTPGSPRCSYLGVDNYSMRLR